MDPSRAPLKIIQESRLNSGLFSEETGNVPRKVDKTPKVKGKTMDAALPLSTPEKHMSGFSAINRFGWAEKNEVELVGSELQDDERTDARDRLVQSCQGFGTVNGGLAVMTPRSSWPVGTPTASVSKVPNRGSIKSTLYKGPSCRNTLYKGTSISYGFVNEVEVPHFDLKEDPSFWTDHNVQVLIRIRPLNSMERSMNGYGRCLKQESAQTITWMGQPETRFTFDQVACETVEQEMLFRMAGLPMVENCLSGYNSCMFAYGQTGSGKTYTMLGDIEELEVKPSPKRGMTPRIFEFLFARIQTEEESRRDERLKYACKCSFLEIYNEQIIDLLDPSPTNLLLREDFKKGVYVENLSEYEVRTVGDILKLLTQGSSNRKVAATNMNKESSRSHSVFTCVIESRWEKDNTTNLRFARLNLVDLAGSERQKSSGAEGERLKEAANINKSLSTLGHVITVLTDVAHGKPKHVPYRDSRLTFLLQDSLGGNSKTMIIANVSPSICCAAETLDTLKFAQRAKLIQNNALMNEDSWGDVTALQRQIQLLKEELSILKHQKVSRSLSFGPTILQDTAHVHENACTGKILEDQQKVYELLGSESNCNLRMSSKQLKYYETTLAGALRREQKAETSIKQLEAEIEQLNNLVHQRETENRCTKMMLRFREDKIQRMESLVSSLIPVDSYLLQENSAISEEIQCLQTKVESNPEVTRFALENIRLLDQLRRFQDFYKEGERNMLLAEVSGLRDQLLQFLDGNSKQDDHQIMKMPPQAQEDFCRIKGHDTLHLELTHTLNELEECRSNLNSCLEDNTKLSRELDDLRSLLNNLESAPRDRVEKFHVIKSSSTDASLFGSQFLEEAQKEKVDEKHENLMNHTEEIMNLKLELNVLKILLQEEKSSRGEVEDKAAWLNTDLELTKEKVLLISKQCEEEKGKLKDAKFIIEALESEKILLINEMEDLRKSNNHYVELLSEHELEIFVLKEQFHSQEFTTHLPLKPLESDGSPLQAKLKRMQDSFKKAKKLNLGYQNDCAFQIPNGEKIGDVLMEIEADFSEVITCLQEDISILQQKVQDGNFKELDARKNGMLLETELKGQQEILHIMTQDYGRLHEKHEEKNGELKTLTEEWNLLIREIEEVLSGGHEALFAISDQLDLKRTSILAQFCRLIRIISEKELLIKELNTCLEDAGNERSCMDCMMKSLRGATQVITEAQQQELREKEKEIFLLTSQLNANLSTIEKLENRLKLGEDNIKKASVCATVAFVIVNRLSEMNLSQLSALKEKDIQLNESIGMNLRKDTLLQDQAAAVEQAEEQIQFLCKGLELSDENLGELRIKLAEEQKRACAMERKLGDIEENDILRTKEKLAELKTGVSTLRSCMSMYVKQVGSPEKENAHVCMSADGNCEGQTDTEPYQDTANIDSYCMEVPKIDSSNCPFKTDAESNQGTANIDISGCPFKTDTSMCRSRDEKKLEPGRTNKDVCDREVTIFLLEKEIESALRSLNEVHVEIAKLHDEKEDIWLSKKQSEESMKQLVAHVLALQAAISNFEEHSMLKLVAFDHKLQTIEQNVQDTDSHWCRTKELVEQEVINAKVVAAQKTTEASCILAKFEEAQYTMKEADKMTYGLMIDNETMKLGIRGLKNEKGILANEVQRLQSINDMRHWQYENLETQIGSSLVETMGLVMELEDVVQVETTFKEDFRSLAHDIHCLKSQVLDFTKLMRSWFEDISTEIIMKDCAVSLLHTCHNGTLLESITGLNAENALLHHMLCELNSVIADLREHNLKSRREIELCRILKGELLDDLKNSFDCISRKDEETVGLSLKLTTFGQKISDLQLQEELVLQRFNNMGSELAVLIKELDMSNTNLVASLLDREKLIRDKEAAMQTQAEIFMVDLFTKDFQSLILALALEEETLRNVHMEKEQIGYGTVVENLKERMIFHKVDAELKEKLLMEKDVEVARIQNEVEETQKKRQDLLAKLSESCLRIAEMGEVNKVLEKAIQCQADFFMADFLENDFQSFILASASEEMALRVADMKNEQISYGAVLDSLKEGMIFLKVDAEMNEMLLVDKDVVVALIQNEVKETPKKNHNLLAKLNESHSRIAEMDGATKFLEEAVQSHVDFLVTEFLAQDFQSLILASALGEMALREADINMEVEETQNKNRDLLAKLGDSNLRNAEMDEKNKVLEEAIQSQADLFVTDFFTKDFQSVILSSRLEEMALREADMKVEQISYGAVLDNLKEGMIYFKVNAEWEKRLLQNEVEETQNKNWGLLAKLGDIHLINAEMDEKNRVLEEAIQSQADLFMTDFFAKDFQSVILSSGLEEMSLREADMKAEQISYSAVLDNLKEGIIYLKVNAEWKEILLQNEVEETQNKNWDLLANLGDSHLRIAKMAEENKVLEEAIQSQANLFMTDFYAKDFQSAILSSGLEGMALREADMSAKLISYGAVIDNLKEGMIFLKVNAEWKEMLLQNEVEETQKKNWDLLAKLGDSHLRIAEMDKENKVLEEAIQSQADLFMTDIFAKDFQSLILASKLEEMALQETDLNMVQMSYGAVLDNLKEGMTLLKVDAEFKEMLLVDKVVEVALLQNEVENTVKKSRNLFAKLSESRLRVAEVDEANKFLELEVLLLKDVSRLNDALKSELAEVMEAKVVLLAEVQSLEAEYANLLQELMTKEITLELSSKHMADVDLENQKLERDIGMLKTSSYELRNEFIMKDAKMSCLEEENELLKNEVRELKSETGILFQDLQKKKSDYDSSLGRINVFGIENLRLQDENSFLEACIANLQIDMDSKITEMNELQHFQSVIMEELSSKTQDWQVLVNRINALEEENVFLKTELSSHEKIILKCVGSVESLDMMSSRVLNTLNQENMTIIGKIFEVICRCVERTSKYTEELECLEFFANNLLSENLLLQTELSRKDDVIKGLSLDLCQEHESASNGKDEIEKLTASFRALEDELAVKSSELDGAVSHIQMLEFQLHEKLSIISTLELDISNERESVKLLSSKNIELSARIEAISAAKRSIEEELTERKKVTDGLNTELFKMGNDLGHTNKSVDCLRRSLNKLTSKRDELHSEVLILKERLHVAEAQQKEEVVCANKKEEKMKWLEKSVEKQECRTTLVGHKVGPMTGEADLQILTAEEFALEFHGVGRKKHTVGDAERKRLEKSVEKQECNTTLVGHKVDPMTGEADLQILTAAEFALEFHGVGRKKHKVGDAERKRLESLGLEEKSLNETTKHIQNLEKDIAERNAKIAQFKGLNREAESSTTQTLRPMTRSMTRSMTHYPNPNPGPVHGKKCSKEGNLHEEAAAPRRQRRRATQSLTGPLMRGPNHDLCG